MSLCCVNSTQKGPTLDSNPRHQLLGLLLRSICASSGETCLLLPFSSGTALSCFAEQWGCWVAPSLSPHTALVLRYAWAGPQIKTIEHFTSININEGVSFMYLFLPRQFAGRVWPVSALGCKAAILWLCSSCWNRLVVLRLDAETVLRSFYIMLHVMETRYCVNSHWVKC